MAQDPRRGRRADRDEEGQRVVGGAHRCGQRLLCRHGARQVDRGNTHDDDRRGRAGPQRAHRGQRRRLDGRRRIPHVVGRSHQQHGVGEKRQRLGHPFAKSTQAASRTVTIAGAADRQVPRVAPPKPLRQKLRDRSARRPWAVGRTSIVAVADDDKARLGSLGRCDDCG